MSTFPKKCHVTLYMPPLQVQSLVSPLVARPVPFAEKTTSRPLNQDQAPAIWRHPVSVFARGSSPSSVRCRRCLVAWGDCFAGAACGARSVPMRIYPACHRAAANPPERWQRREPLKDTIRSPRFSVRGRSHAPLPRGSRSRGRVVDDHHALRGLERILSGGFESVEINRKIKPLTNLTAVRGILISIPSMFSLICRR